MRRRALAALRRFRRPAVAAGAAFGVVTFLKYPALFWIGVVIGLVVALLVVIDQRDEAAARWADELFRAAGVKHKNKLLTEVNLGLLERNEELVSDNAAIRDHLAEVLKDHAECPAPVVTT